MHYDLWAVIISSARFNKGKLFQTKQNAWMHSGTKQNFSLRKIMQMTFKVILFKGTQAQNYSDKIFLSEVIITSRFLFLFYNFNSFEFPTSAHTHIHRVSQNWRAYLKSYIFIILFCDWKCNIFFKHNATNREFL